MPEQDTDIIISGGGMVGAALALALSESGLRIDLVEQRSQAQVDMPDPLQRASFIVEGSLRFLQGLGLSLEALGTPVQRMRIWDADHFGSIGFDAEDIREARLGVIVENRRLEQCLHGALAGKANVHVHYQQQITQPDAFAGEMRCQLNGATWRCRLLAVAEGRESLLRQALHIPLQSVDYAQKAIIATVQVERPHQGVAYQRFLPSGPLALLPFSDSSDGQPRCSIVWSVAEGQADALMQLDDVAFIERLGLAFGPQLGRVTATGPRGMFPLSASYAKHYFTPQAVLLGDSAHGVHPLAGLGVNLGLRDAACLSGLIQADLHGNWSSLALLRDFERQRRPDNMAVFATTHSINRLFSNDLAPLAWLRDTGLLAVNAALPVKRWLLRQAMGL